MKEKDKLPEDSELGFIKYGTDPSELGKIEKSDIDLVSKKSGKAAKKENDILVDGDTDA